jgi:hypothetical protein
MLPHIKQLSLLVIILVTYTFHDSATAQEAAPSTKTRNFFVLLWPNQDPADAQLDLSEPLVTDRPDFTEASSTVGRGITQTEWGYTFGYDRSDEHRAVSHSYPELLLRQGVAYDWLEFRFGANAVSLDSKGESPTGAEDLYTGIKIGLVPQKGYLPEISVVPQVTLPTGSDAITTDHTLFGTNLLYAWDISEESYLGASTQFNRSVDASGALYTEWAQSVTIGTALAQSVGCYFEWFAFFPRATETEPERHFINGGFAYLVDKDQQWDIRAGTRVDDLAHESFMGVGWSLRFGA